MRSVSVPMVILIACLICAGCTGNTARAKSSFSVDSSGFVTLNCAPDTVSEEVLFSNETYTKSRVVFQTQNGNVTTFFSIPKSPKAAFVYAPGAGEILAAHEERMIRFASAGNAFVFVDSRGNGGETAGLPFGQQLIQQDYAKFEKGEMPQYYQSICDLISVRKFLAGRYNIPVYAIGSSNGGRYAAVAAGMDEQFAGYVGISTSDWGLLESLKQQGITGDPLRFATSIEPSTYLTKISPRPVWIFHAKADPVIPFERGQQFFKSAQEPKTFIEFSGDHGINPEVDMKIIEQWA